MTAGTKDNARRFAAFEAAVAAEHRRRRVLFSAGMAVFLALFLAACWVGEVSLERLVRGAPGLLGYVGQTIPTVRPAHLLEDVREWQWGFLRWMRLLFDTVAIAVLATLLGFTAATGACFFASRNLVQRWWVIAAARRFLEACRTIPELIYAMIFVYAFGIGPLAGILALAVHSAGALGKLFSEVNENTSLGAAEAIRSAGGRWADQARYGVLPQVLPSYLSYGLLRFEINIRAATVTGFVGAGGIGTELMFEIRQFQHTSVSAIVVWIILLVMLVDFASEKVRRRVAVGGAA